ncbi:MAG: HU family DNA-binding protein [bacterium]
MTAASQQTTNLKDIAHDVQRDNPHLGSRADVEHLLKCSLNIILERVAHGHQVKFRGFGVFEASLFKGRKLTSPLMKDQGGAVEFPDQLVLRFRQSQSAKAVINKLHDEMPKKKASKADDGKEGEKPPAKKGAAKKGAAKKDTKKTEPETKKSPAKKPAAKKSKKGGAKKGAAKKDTTSTPAAE